MIPNVAPAVRHAGQTRYMDTVAFVRAAFDDFSEKNNLVMPFAHGDVEIFDARQARGEFGQFVIMRGEQSFRADLIVQMLDDGPRERKAIECARAASDFIQHDEAA